MSTHIKHFLHLKHRPEQDMPFGFESDIDSRVPNLFEHYKRLRAAEKLLRIDKSSNYVLEEIIYLDSYPQFGKSTISFVKRSKKLLNFLLDECFGNTNGESKLFSMSAFYRTTQYKDISLNLIQHKWF